MGKGNAILGYARGAVASVVFTRIKGQQIIKGRNSKPHNKRSRKQIMHRARLSTLYKFTKQMPPGLLEGAFEDQRPRENWQACFVRHNINNAIMQMKSWVEDENKAAYGKFLMSQGSININLCKESHAEASTYLGAVGISIISGTSQTLVYGFSRLLMDQYGVHEGDIVTFIIYDVPPPSSIRDPRYHTSNKVPTILCTSFKINLSDNRSIKDVVKYVTQFAYTDDAGNTRFWLGIRITLDYQPAMAIVITRQDGHKTLVNSAKLIWPGANEAFWQQFESDTWVSSVLRTWGMSRTAVLAGE